MFKSNPVCCRTLGYGCFKTVCMTDNPVSHKTAVASPCNTDTRCINIGISCKFIFKLFSVGGTIYGFLELWKISIYAAFPVIFVVNFFPALQLPGTGYFSWLFMIGWVIYLFVVLRFLFQSYDNEDNNDGEANERA